MAEEQFNIYNLQDEDWEKEANPQADVGELGSSMATFKPKEKDPKYSESQNKEAKYAISMENAEKYFSDLEGGRYDESGVPYEPQWNIKDALVAALLPDSVEKLLLSEQYQLYESQKAIWLNQVVRSVTGAQVAEGEVDREAEFFPRMFEDGPAIEAKRIARKERLEAVKVAAGPAYTAIKENLYKNAVRSARARLNDPNVSEEVKDKIRRRLKVNGIRYSAGASQGE